MESDPPEILCRVCLIECSDSNFDIYDVGFEDKTYKDVIEKITGFFVTNDEPAYVCDACAMQLVEAFKCKQTLEETQLILDQVKVLNNIKNENKVKFKPENSCVENMDEKLIEVYVDVEMINQCQETAKLDSSYKEESNVENESTVMNYNSEDWNVSIEDEKCDYCDAYDGMEWSRQGYKKKVVIKLSPEIVHHFQTSHLGRKKTVPTKPILKMYHYFQVRRIVIWFICAECNEICYSNRSVYKHRKETNHMASYVEDGYQPRENLLPYKVKLPPPRAPSSRNCRSIYKTEPQDEI